MRAESEEPLVENTLSPGIHQDFNQRTTRTGYSPPKRALSPVRFAAYGIFRFAKIREGNPEGI